MSFVCDSAVHIVQCWRLVMCMIRTRLMSKTVFGTSCAVEGSLCLVGLHVLSLHSLIHLRAAPATLSCNIDCQSNAILVINFETGLSQSSSFNVQRGSALCWCQHQNLHMHMQPD